MVPGIIHNFATPLSGVLGATQLLEKRAAAMEELLRASEQMDAARRGELLDQAERSRTNVEILARNAQHLVGMLQVLVQRINRGAGDACDFNSLNELLQDEVRFLDANLLFKHKVNKRSNLAEKMPCVRCIYGHVASVIEEFVIGTLRLHDTGQGSMEMEFTTTAEPPTITISAVFAPRASAESDICAPLEPHLARLREEGWAVEHTLEPLRRELRLVCPRGSTMP